MSRNAAKRRYTARDLEEQTRGVECRKDSGVVDEIPGAYKSIDQVIEQQRDLVEVVARLKQVVCVKAERSSDPAGRNRGGPPRCPHGARVNSPEGEGR